MAAVQNLVFQVFAACLLDSNPTLQAVFLENSPLMPSRGLEDILHEFSIRGFKVAWGIFSARDVGARTPATPVVLPSDSWVVAANAVSPDTPTGRSKGPLACFRKRLETFGICCAEPSCWVISVVPSCASNAYNTLNLALQDLLESDSPAKHSDHGVRSRIGALPASASGTCLTIGGRHHIAVQESFHMPGAPGRHR